MGVEMKMDKKKIAGLVSGILGALFLYIYTEHIRNVSGVSSGFVEVLVSKREIEMGERLTMDILDLKKIPRKYLSSSMVLKRDVDAVLMRKVTSRVPKGEYILWHILQEDAYGGFSGKIPSGKRAVAFNVDEVSSVGYMIKTGDVVDVIGVFRKDGELYSGFVLQNVLVLSGPVRGSSTIVLSLSPEEANALLLASSAGTISFVLRNPEDGKPVSVPFLSYSDFSHSSFDNKTDEVIVIKGK
jgi:pilus assembly protein CpaB